MDHLVASSNNVVPENHRTSISGNWQMIALSGGLIVVVLVFAYFLYRFVAQTRNKINAMEQTIQVLNERIKQQQPSSPPPPAAVYQRQHEMFMPPMHMVPPPPKPPVKPTPVVIDAKALDKELTEELKELSVEVPEGRVDATPPNEPKV